MVNYERLALYTTQKREQLMAEAARARLVVRLKSAPEGEVKSTKTRSRIVIWKVLHRLRVGQLKRLFDIQSGQV